MIARDLIAVSKNIERKFYLGSIQMFTMAPQFDMSLDKS